MNKEKVLERVRIVAKAERKSKNTISSYSGKIAQYYDFTLRLPREMPSEEKARRFLEKIAPNVSASTQELALNAVVWLYRSVLRRPLGDIGSYQYAARPETLPVWLTTAEVSQLWPHMRGSTRLMAQICFGSGLRREEVCSLRVKDLDPEAGKIIVRRGKGKGGGKDRVTCFPRSLRMATEAHLQKVRRLWETDRQSARPGVYLPGALDRKYPRAATSWEWFWLFPAASESRDPETGITRRHHVIPDTLRKAVKRAVACTPITKQPVGVHTLRHSFAVAMLEQGCRIEDLKEMMGHARIETTLIYAHCAERFTAARQSPLDTAPIIPFPTAHFPSPLTALRS